MYIILKVTRKKLKSLFFYRRYAYIINNMFAKIIGLQFAVSMFVLCSNLYRIAMATDYVTFVSLIMYTGAILAQIFIYCWFGNEVKVKVYISLK